MFVFEKSPVFSIKDKMTKNTIHARELYNYHKILNYIEKF